MNMSLIASFVHAFGGLFNQLTRDPRPASQRPPRPEPKQDPVVGFCYRGIQVVGFLWYSLLAGLFLTWLVHVTIHGIDFIQ